MTVRVHLLVLMYWHSQTPDWPSELQRKLCATANAVMRRVLIHAQVMGPVLGQTKEFVDDCVNQHMSGVWLMAGTLGLRCTAVMHQAQ